MARADRTGKRKSRAAFKTRIPDLGYYFIITDTDKTEKNYLQGLRDSLPKELQGRIVIKVSKAKTRELVESCKEQAALEPQYGQPWIVFDRDEVGNFDEIIAKAQMEGIGVGWSNPCIEIWFDAYFGAMHAYNNSTECWKGFEKTFEQQTGHKYQKNDPHIYELLNRFGNEERAIEIADKRWQGHLRNGINKPSEMCPCSTVYKLIDEIRRKTGQNATEKSND